MAVFFDRTDSGDTIRVRFYPWAQYAFIAGIAGASVVSVLSGADSRALTAAAALFMVALAIQGASIVFTWRIRQLIFRKMKVGAVKVSGSRIDPRRPMTYWIQK